MAEPNYKGMTDAEIVDAWKEWEALDTTPYEQAFDLSHLVLLGVKPGYEKEVTEVMGEDGVWVNDFGEMTIDVGMPSIGDKVKEGTLMAYWMEELELNGEWFYQGYSTYG